MEDPPDAYMLGPGQRSATSSRTAGRAPKGSSSSSRPGFLLVLLPWLMFVLITALFTYGYHHIPGLVWVTVCLCSCFALIFIFTSGPDPESRSAMSLGVLCTFGIGLGVLAGLHNYNVHMEPYWMYEEAREYKNVLPSEPAAAHADAGKITFAMDAKIDTTKSVGYKAGMVYCVAPIMDPSSLNRVEFWAVGTDCCAQRGEFSCDDSALEGDDAAHGGIVVFESSFIAPGHFQYFHKAVREAEAANDLVSAQEPIFVRWVKDPAIIQAGLFGGGTGALLGYSVLHLLANVALAYSSKIIQNFSERSRA